MSVWTGFDSIEFGILEHPFADLAGGSITLSGRRGTTQCAPVGQEELARQQFETDVC